MFDKVNLEKKGALHPTESRERQALRMTGLEANDPSQVRYFARLFAHKVQGAGKPRKAITSDAEAVVRLGNQARFAIAWNRSADGNFIAAENILSRYHLRIVRDHKVSQGVMFAESSDANPEWDGEHLIA